MAIFLLSERSTASDRLKPPPAAALPPAEEKLLGAAMLEMRTPKPPAPPYTLGDLVAPTRFALEKDMVRELLDIVEELVFSGRRGGNVAETEVGCLYGS